MGCAAHSGTASLPRYPPRRTPRWSLPRRAAPTLVRRWRTTCAGTSRRRHPSTLARVTLAPLAAPSCSHAAAGEAAAARAGWAAWRGSVRGSKAVPARRPHPPSSTPASAPAAVHPPCTASGRGLSSRLQACGTRLPPLPCRPRPDGRRMRARTRRGGPPGSLGATSPHVRTRPAPARPGRAPTRRAPASRGCASTAALPAAYAHSILQACCASQVQAT